jgi:endoglucanase
MTALWTEIARHCADEPMVYGYGLLNEPVVVNGLSQWGSLASRIAASVRTIDRKHLVVVERVLGDKGLGADQGNANQNGEMNFVLLNDPNIMYEFHFYLPSRFTHQNADWLAESKGWVGSVWPDPGRAEVTAPIGDAAIVAESTKISSGTTDWKRFESKPVRVKDAGIKVGRIGLKGNGIGSGTVWYDDVTVTETDSKGLVSRAWSWSLDYDDKLFYWASPSQGIGTRAIGEGRGGSSCYRLAGCGAEAFLFNINDFMAVRPGYSYVISGWMKGSKIAVGASAGFWLGLVKAGKVFVWDKNYLSMEIGRFLAFRDKHDVPVFMGEFGTIADSYSEDRGGLRWVEDVLDVCADTGLGYNFFSWHGRQFGIHSNPEWEPVKEVYANRELIDLFTRKQAR